MLSKRSLSSRFPLFILSGLTLLLLPQLISGQSPSSDRLATITLVDAKTNDPVHLLDFLVKGLESTQRVKSGQFFRVKDPAWYLKSFIELRNVSGKTIIGIWVGFHLPESSDGTSVVGDQSHLGGVPQHAMFHPDGTPLRGQVDLLVHYGPLDMINLPLVQHVDQVDALLSKRKAHFLTHAEVRVDAVYFDDGTKWGPGYFGKADLTQPGKYIQILPEEFYKAEVTGR